MQPGNAAPIFVSGAAFCPAGAILPEPHDTDNRFRLEFKNEDFHRTEVNPLAGGQDVADR